MEELIKNLLEANGRYEVIFYKAFPCDGEERNDDQFGIAVTKSGYEQDGVVEKILRKSEIESLEFNFDDAINMHVNSMKKELER